MNLGRARKPKPKQPPRNERRAHNNLRQLILGLILQHPRPPPPPLLQRIPKVVPQRRDAAGNNHGHQQPRKRQPNLPQVEVMIRRKDQWKRSKEEIQQAQEHGSVNIQDQSHGLKHQDLERSQQRKTNSLWNRLCRPLNRRIIPLVTRLLSDSRCLSLQQNGI